MKLDNILTGVQHIGIPTADMAATEKFYLSLGFEFTERYSDSPFDSTLYMKYTL